MGMEPMTVRVEVWPVAADRFGIWLLSGGDAWRSQIPVESDGEPHADVETLLHEHGASEDVALLHSTSWRVDGPHVVLTYMAVVQATGVVRERWSDAQPISLELADAVGKPPGHAPIEPPTPRYIDVLMHGLRHLRFLLDTDGRNRAVMSPEWRRHLATLEPALSGMYEPESKADATT